MNLGLVCSAKPEMNFLTPALAERRKRFLKEQNRVISEEYDDLFEELVVDSNAKIVEMREKCKGCIEDHYVKHGCARVSNCSSECEVEVYSSVDSRIPSDVYRRYYSMKHRKRMKERFSDGEFGCTTMNHGDGYPGGSRTSTTCRIFVKMRKPSPGVLERIIKMVKND